MDLPETNDSFCPSDNLLFRRQEFGTWKSSVELTGNFSIDAASKTIVVQPNDSPEILEPVKIMLDFPFCESSRSYYGDAMYFEVNCRKHKASVGWVTKEEFSTGSVCKATCFDGSYLHNLRRQFEPQFYHNSLVSGRLKIGICIYYFPPTYNGGGKS